MTDASKLVSRLRGWPARFEMLLVGPLAPEVRHSMHIDLRAACVGSLLSVVLGFVPIVLRRLGASDGQLALYLAITALGLMTTSLGVWLMRRFGSRRVAVLSWLVGRASFLVAALATSAVGLLSLLSLFWLLESWPSPAYVQTLQVIYPASQRGRIMGLVRVGLVATILVLTPIAGWILDRFGYRVLMPLASFSGIASTLLFYPLLRHIRDTPAEPAPIGPARTPSPSVWRLLKDRPVQLYMIGTMIFGMGAVVATTLYPIVQVDRLNLSYTVIGLLGLVQSLFWLLGYLFGGRLVDRFGGIRCLQAVYALYIVVILPYAVANQAWTLLPAFAASGLVNAGSDLASLYSLMDLAGPERVPETTALNSTFTGLRGLVGPFIGPLLVHAGWPLWTVLVMCAVLALAGAGFLQVLPRRAVVA